MRGSVTKRGKSYRVRVDAGADPVTGRRRYLTATRKTKREADELLARMIVDAGRGSALGSDATVAELVDAWLRSSRRISPSYRYDVELAWRKVPAWLRKAPVWKLRSSDLDRCYGELLDGGVSPWRVRRVHEALSSALGQAVRWEWVARNVAHAASPPVVRRRRIEPPSPDVVGRFLAAADPELRLWIRLAATTGARRGEVAALRWGDVDLDRGRLLIRGALAYAPGAGVYEKGTKTDRERVVALDPGTVAELGEQRARQTAAGERLGVAVDGSSWILSTDPAGVRPWRPDLATARFARLRARLAAEVDDPATVEAVTLKVCRHYVATRLLGAGFDPKTVAGRLGHSRVSVTTDVYAAWLPELDADAALRVAAELD